MNWPAPQQELPDDMTPGGPGGYDPERARSIAQSILDDYMQGGEHIIDPIYRLKDVVSLLTPPRDERP